MIPVVAVQHLTNSVCTSIGEVFRKLEGTERQLRVASRLRCQRSSSLAVAHHERVTDRMPMLTNPLWPAFSLNDDNSPIEQARVRDGVHRRIASGRVKHRRTVPRDDRERAPTRIRGATNHRGGEHVRLDDATVSLCQ